MAAGRVLHLLSQRPGWTGSGVALDAMVRAARQSGWLQAVVVGSTPEDPPPEVGGLEASRIRPLEFDSAALPFRLPGMSDVMPYPSSRFSELTGGRLEAYRRAWQDHVAEALERFRPDLVHSHHVWLMSSWVKELTDLPVVTHCHGTGLRQRRLSPHLAEEVRAGCARNDAFVVLHQGHREALTQWLGVEPERVRVVGSGYREEIFHAEGRPSSSPPRVAYVGKLSEAKGLPWLLDAMEEVARRLPGARLDVAGSGAGAEAEAIRRRMGRLAFVRYHGQLDQPRLAELLRGAAVFALPSFYEGLPLVLVEAAACGCRLVSTALPGVVGELAPVLGDSLRTVPLPRLEGADRPLAEDLPAFVARLAEAIEAALREPPPGEARRSVAGMTWRAVFGRIEAVWRDLAG